MKMLIKSLILTGALFLYTGEAVMASSLNYVIPTIKNTTNDISPDYVFALNAADRFLHAWLMRDYKEGINYISDELKQSVSEEELITFFGDISNPDHMAYEVVGWRLIDENTIKFHIWLYEYVANESSNFINQPEPFYIEVVRIDNDKWRVNTLPMRENYYHGADNI
jgi:hypothetical protein